MRAASVDPASERGAEIVEIDPVAGTLTLKLGPKNWGRIRCHGR